MSHAEIIKNILQNEWVAIVSLVCFNCDPEYEYGRLKIPKLDEEIIDVLCKFGIKVLSINYGFDIDAIDDRILDIATFIKPPGTSPMHPRFHAYLHKLINFPITFLINNQSEIKDNVVYPVHYCDTFRDIKNIFVNLNTDRAPNHDLNYVSTFMDCHGESLDHAKSFKTKYLHINIYDLPQDFCSRWHELLDGTALEFLSIFSRDIDLELSPIPSDIYTRIRGYSLVIGQTNVKHDSLEEACMINNSARYQRTKSANR